MPQRSVAHLAALALATVSVVLLLSALCPAQNQQGPDPNVQNTVAGVAVDAAGMLQLKAVADPNGTLTRERLLQAKASLDPRLAAPSRLRKISLTRLEAAVREHHGVPTDDMRYLAGLLRVRYVFCCQESNDIVLAGPAEGWMVDLAGRVVGIGSRRPVIRLDDLIVALRAFPPGKPATPLIGCSIDPTEQGLAAMQGFLRTWGARATPADTAELTDGLLTSLGPHAVKIDGVSPRTHFAQALVEADYRMKLIAIGRERLPVRMLNYIDRASPAQAGRNALERWYFVPEYQCLRISDDKLAAELVGDGVKLLGQSETVTTEGHRQAGKTVNKASQAFTVDFTKHYAEIAERSPAFAELRNLIDLAVAAALIQQQDYCGQAHWKMDLLGDERQLAVDTLTAPSEVAAALNVVWKGSHLMTPVGGGVEIDAARALRDENQWRDENGKLAKTQREIKLNPAPGRWWWD